MTDVDGLYDSNPAQHDDAKRISDVDKLTPDVIAMAGDAGSSFGTGGMASKLVAAKIATESGVTTAIINGSDETSLAQLLAGEDVGTVFLCGDNKQSWHQHWISNLLPVSGILNTSRKASEHRNLMIEEITKIEGRFDKGECVELWNEEGLIGRGLTNYNSEDMLKLMGHQSKEIEAVLGYVDFISMVHTDNLVWLESN